jgi:hypothetical protein
VTAHWQYLKYVIRHKWFVFVAGLVVGAPLWRLLVHDWTKFLPSEWGPYVMKFYGRTARDRYVREGLTQLVLSPAGCPDSAVAMQYVAVIERRWDASVDVAFDVAWNHHQKRNPHHWEYYLRSDGTPIRMPDACVREMVADWMGAGRAKSGRWEAHAWYGANAARMALDPGTRTLVESILARAHAAGRA